MAGETSNIQGSQGAGLQRLQRTPGADAPAAPADAERPLAPGGNTDQCPAEPCQAPLGIGGSLQAKYEEVLKARGIIRLINERIASGDREKAFELMTEENLAALINADYSEDAVRDCIRSLRPISYSLNLRNDALRITHEGRKYLTAKGIDLFYAARYLDLYNASKEQASIAYLLGGRQYKYSGETVPHVRKSFAEMWKDRAEGSLSQQEARDLFKDFIDSGTLFDDAVIDVFFALPLDEDAAVEMLVGMAAKRLGPEASLSLASSVRRSAAAVWGLMTKMRYEAARQGLARIKELDIEAYKGMLTEIQGLASGIWEARLKAMDDPQLNSIAGRMKAVTDQAEKFVMGLQAYGTSDAEKAKAIQEIEANAGLLEAAGYDVESLKFNIRKGKILAIDSQRAAGVIMSEQAEGLFSLDIDPSESRTIPPHDFFRYRTFDDPLIAAAIKETRTELLSGFTPLSRAEAEHAISMVEKGFWAFIIDVSEEKDDSGRRSRLTISLYLSKGNREIEQLCSSVHTLKDGSEAQSASEPNPFLMFVQKLISRINPAFSAVTGRIDNYTYEALRNLRSNPSYEGYFPDSQALQERRSLKPDDMTGDSLTRISEGVKPQTPRDISEQAEAARLAYLISTGSVFGQGSALLTGPNRRRILELAMSFLNTSPANLTRSTQDLSQDQKVQWRKRLVALRDKLLDEKGFDQDTASGRALAKIQRKLIFFCVIAEGVARGSITREDAVAEVEKYLEQARLNEENTRITDESDPSRILEQAGFRGPDEILKLAALGIEFRRFISQEELTLLREYNLSVADPLNRTTEDLFRSAGLKDGDIYDLKTLDLDPEYSRRLNETASIVGRIAGTGLTVDEVILAQNLAVMVPDGVQQDSAQRVVVQALGMAFAGIDADETRKGRYVEARTAAAETAERYTSLIRRQHDDFVFGSDFSNRLVDRIIIDGEALRAYEKMEFFKNSPVAYEMVAGPSGQGVRIKPGNLPDPSADGYRPDERTHTVERYAKEAPLSAIVSAISGTGYPLAGLPGVQSAGVSSYGREEVDPPVNEMCGAHIRAAARVFGGSNYLINGVLADDEEINLIRRLTEKDLTAILSRGTGTGALTAEERSLLIKVRQWCAGYQTLLSEEDVKALSSLSGGSKINDLGRMILARVSGFLKPFKQGLSEKEINDLNKFADLLEKKGSYILSLGPEERVEALFSGDPELSKLYYSVLNILKKIAYGLQTSLVMRDLVKKRDASQGFGATLLYAISSGNREAGIDASNLVQQMGAQSWLISLLKMHFFTDETVSRLKEIQTAIDSLRGGIKQLEGQIIALIRKQIREGRIKPKNEEEIKRLLSHLLYDTKEEIFLSEDFSALKEEIKNLKQRLVDAKKEMVRLEIEANKVYTYIFDGSIDKKLWDRLRTLPGIYNYSSYFRELFRVSDRTRLVDIDGHIIWDDLVQVVEEGMEASGGFNSFEVCVGEEHEVTRAKLAFQILLNGLDQDWKNINWLRTIAAAPGALSGGIWTAVQFLVGGALTGVRPEAGRRETGPSSYPQVIDSLFAERGFWSQAGSAFTRRLSQRGGYSQPVGSYLKQVVGYHDPARYFIGQLSGSAGDYFKAQNSVSGDDILAFIGLAENELIQIDRYGLGGKADELTKPTEPGLRYRQWHQYFEQLRRFAGELKEKGQSLVLFNPEHYEGVSKMSGGGFDSRYVLSVMLLDYLAIRGTLPQPAPPIELFDCPYQGFDPQTFVKDDGNSSFRVTHFVKGSIPGAALAAKTWDDVTNLFRSGFLKDGLQLSDLDDIGKSLGRGYLDTLVDWYYLIPLDIAAMFADYSSKAVNCLLNGDYDGFKKFSIEALKTVWHFLRWESGLELFRLIKDTARESQDPAEAFARLFTMLPILIGSAQISRATFGVGLTSVIDLIRVSARASRAGVELLRNGQLNRAGLRGLPEGTLRYIFEPLTEPFLNSYLWRKITGQNPERASLVGSRVVDIADLTLGNLFRGVRRLFGGSTGPQLTVTDIYGAEASLGEVLIEGGLRDLSPLERLGQGMRSAARRLFHEPLGSPRQLGLDAFFDSVDTFAREGLSRISGGRVLRANHVTLAGPQGAPSDVLRTVTRGLRTNTFDFVVQMSDPWPRQFSGNDLVVFDPAADNLGGQYTAERNYRIRFSDGKSVEIRGEYLTRLMLADTPEGLRAVREAIRTGQHGGVLPSLAQLELIRQGMGVHLSDLRFSLTEYGVVSMFNVRNAGGFVDRTPMYQLDLALRRAVDLAGDQFMTMDEAVRILRESSPALDLDMIERLRNLPDVVRQNIVNEFLGVFQRMREHISNHTDQRMMQRFVMFECPRLEALARAQRPAAAAAGAGEAAAPVAGGQPALRQPLLGLPDAPFAAAEELPLAADVPPEEGGARSGKLSRGQAATISLHGAAVDAAANAKIQTALDNLAQEQWFSEETRAKAAASGERAIRFKTVPDAKWPSSLEGGMVWKADGKGGYDVYIRASEFGSRNFESDLLHEMVEIHLRERGNAEGIHDVASEAGDLFERNGRPDARRPVSGVPSEEPLRVTNIEEVGRGGAAVQGSAEPARPASEPAARPAPGTATAPEPAPRPTAEAGTGAPARPAESAPATAEAARPAGQVSAEPARPASEPAARPSPEAPRTAAPASSAESGNAAAEVRAERALPGVPEAPNYRVRVLGELNTWGHIGRDVALLELLNVIGEGHLPVINEEFWVRQRNNLLFVAGLHYGPKLSMSLIKFLFPGLAARLGANPAMSAAWSRGLGLGMGVLFSALHGFNAGLEPGNNMGDSLRKVLAAEAAGFILGGGGHLLLAAITGGAEGASAAAGLGAGGVITGGSIIATGGICAIVAGAAFVGGEIAGTIHYYNVNKDNIQVLTQLEIERLNGVGIKAAANGWIAPTLRRGLDESNIQATLRLQASTVVLRRLENRLRQEEAGLGLEEFVAGFKANHLTGSWFFGVGGNRGKAARLLELASPRTEQEKEEKARLETELREVILKVLEEHPEKVYGILSPQVIQETINFSNDQSRLQQISYGCFQRRYRYYDPGFWNSTGADSKIANYGFMAQLNSLFAFKAATPDKRQGLRVQVSKMFGNEENSSSPRFRGDQDIIAFLDHNLPNWRWLLLPKSQGGDREAFAKLLPDIYRSEFVTRYMNRIDRHEVIPRNLAQIYIDNPGITCHPRDYWKTYQVSPSLSWEETARAGGQAGEVLLGAVEYCDAFLRRNLSAEDYTAYQNADPYKKPAYVERAKKKYAADCSAEIKKIKDIYYGDGGYFAKLGLMKDTFLNRGLEVSPQGKISMLRTINRSAFRQRLGDISDDNFEKLLSHLFLNAGEDYLMPNVSLIGALDAKLNGLKGQSVITEAQRATLAVLMRDLLLNKTEISWEELKTTNNEFALYISGCVKYLLSLYVARGTQVNISDDFVANMKALNGLTSNAVLNGGFISGLLDESTKQVNAELAQLRKGGGS